MRSIFISYRRGDAEGQAGRLFDDLVAHFGKAAVFMDVEDIEPGRDFRRVIDQHVASCGVLLALVGKGWLNALDSEGNRRLDDPNDFVRLETVSALKRDIPVIPVLVQGATMPKSESLPDELKDFAFRNAVELTHARWESDVQILIKALDRYVSAGEGEALRWEGGTERQRREAMTEVGGSGVAVAEGAGNRPPTGEPAPRARPAVATLLASLLAVGLAIGGYAIYEARQKGGEEQNNAGKLASEREAAQRAADQQKRDSERAEAERRIAAEKEAAERDARQLRDAAAKIAAEKEAARKADEQHKADAARQEAERQAAEKRRLAAEREAAELAARERRDAEAKIAAEKEAARKAAAERRAAAEREAAAQQGRRERDTARESRTPATAPAGFRIVEMSLRADPANYSGPCPVTITFVGRVSVAGGGGTVSYRFLRSDNASAPLGRLVFDAPGSKSVRTTWRLGGPSRSYTGYWQAIKTFDPEEKVSNRATFSIQCD